jgi:hypothetical protein
VFSGELMDVDEVLNFSEIGISCDNACILSLSLGHSKGSGISDWILGLDFRCRHHQIIGTGIYFNGKELYPFKDISGKGKRNEP